MIGGSCLPEDTVIIVISIYVERRHAAPYQLWKEFVIVSVGTGGYPIASGFGQAHGGVGVAHVELKTLALTVRPR